MMSNSEEPAPNTKAEAIKASNEEGLTAFDRHKKELLDMLRDVCERKPKTKPFDADNSWRSLRFAALAYFWNEGQEKLTRVTTPTTDRVKRLAQIEKGFSRACRLVDEAKQEGDFDYLFWAWYEAHSAYNDEDPMGPLSAAQIEFDKVVAGLVALETAAFRAAEQVRKRHGRPKGTGFLPYDCIICLESVYRDITGKRAGVPGRFAQFVGAFFTAVGHKTEQRRIDEAIKYVRKCEKKYPTTSRWGRSIFDGLGGKTPAGSG
jgi:hypothetical protein